MKELKKRTWKGELAKGAEASGQESVEWLFGANHDEVHDLDNKWEYAQENQVVEDSELWVGLFVILVGKSWDSVLNGWKDSFGVFHDVVDVGIKGFHFLIIQLFNKLLFNL